MSRRRWAIGLGPPNPLAASVPLLLAGVLIGCAGARPTASAGPSALPASIAPARSNEPGIGRPQAADLVGKTWLAEGPRGWEAGRIGGRSVSLGPAEVGVAARGSWILSAILRPTDAVSLLLRDGPTAEPKVIGLGSLAPTAVAIVGDRAYVSGFSFAQPTDPGILEIDLGTATARMVLPPSDAVGTRYLAASADGSTLVSTLCDLVADPEPETCSMSVITLADGVAAIVGDVRGGLLRGTAAGVAVLAPQGPEAPEWLVGVDVRTGTELWTIAGGEFGQSVMSEAYGLIQPRTLTGGPQPRLVIDTIDLRTGAAKVVYEEFGAALPALWPALSSDRFVVVGEDSTGSRSLGASADGRARVRLVPLDGSDPLDVPVALRSKQ